MLNTDFTEVLAVSENENAQGWHCAELQLGMMVYDLFLTTTGEIYCLSNKEKWAKKRRDSATSTGKGMLVDMLQDATVAVMESATDFDSDTGSVEERLAADKRNFVLSCVEIQEFFAGETGWGFSKRRAGIYLRPECQRKMPGIGSPAALSLLMRPYQAPGMTGIMSGWCGALGIPFIGFDSSESFEPSEPSDPIWLSGPEMGTTSQPAAAAFAWMAENVGKNIEPPTPRRAPAGASEDDLQPNVMAKLAPVLAGVAFLALLCGFCGGLFLPFVGSLAPCLIFPLSVAAIILGILGFLNASKRVDEDGKIPALIGVGLGLAMIFLGCAGMIAQPFLTSMIYQIMY